MPASIAADTFETPPVVCDNGIADIGGGMQNHPNNVNDQSIKYRQKNWAMAVVTATGGQDGDTNLVVNAAPIPTLDLVTTTTFGKNKH